ncbi:MAG: O-antigen ligase family protein [Deltaproteobacteria bacterium]|nr:O-antigen ligase family protein [Deltaproteobacteria bacterium]
MQQAADASANREADLKGKKVADRTTVLFHQTAMILIGAFIFFVPIPHTTAIKEFCFYAALAITLFLVISKRVTWSFRSPLALPFLLFALWAFIGLFFAVDKPNSVHDYLAHLIRYIALYYLLVHYYDSLDGLELLSWIIVASLTLFSVGGMICFYGIQGFNLMSDQMLFKEMEVNNIGFSTAVAIIIGLTLYEKQTQRERKLLLLVSLTSATMATFLTHSRAAVAGLTLALCILFPIRKKAVAIFICVIAAVVVLSPVRSFLKTDVVQNSILQNERFNIWRTYFEMAKDYPLTGIGYGMELWKNRELWSHYVNRFPPERKSVTIDPHPHNILMSVLVRTGFVGLGLFVFLLIQFARMCALSIKSRDPVVREWGVCLLAAFMAYFVKAQFETGLDQVPVIFMFTLFAMVTILHRLSSNTTDKDVAPTV